MTDWNDLQNLMINMEEDAVYAAVSSIIENDASAAGATLEALQAAMTEVGNRFESGEYFIGDLLYSAEILKGAMQILRPALAGSTNTGLGKLIICTVKGDIHDIGKNIVRDMLDAAGFEVIDLGIDVAPEAVVEAAKDQDVGIVALSGVLTLAVPAMRNVIEAFDAAGLRGTVKIIVGGNPVTADVCAAIGADAWANSPQKGVEICRAWATGQ
ncbi:MAG: cobalamin-dependent protein [Coriobacteriia bacterium]|nr:cobalamin-dependent protein [Coriobacteriia bacterium]